jgi:vacuolar-type H+-ATPase subunit F/Vma7
MGIVMIGDRYLISGFRLIGIEAVEASDDDTAARKVREIVLEGKHEIVAMTERVAVKVKDLRESLLKTRKAYPIFLIIPDFKGPLNERITELHRLVNQAAGINLKLG